MCPVSQKKYAQNTSFLSFFLNSQARGCEMVSHCGVDFVSLQTSDAKLLFTCPLAVRIGLLSRNVCPALRPFFQSGAVSVVEL